MQYIAPPRRAVPSRDPRRDRSRSASAVCRLRKPGDCAQGEDILAQRRAGRYTGTLSGVSGGGGANDVTVMCLACFFHLISSLLVGKECNLPVPGKATSQNFPELRTFWYKWRFLPNPIGNIEPIFICQKREWVLPCQYYPNYY